MEWYTWVFSGVGVALVSLICKLLYNKFIGKKDSNSNIVVNLYRDSSNHPDKCVKTPISIEDLKIKTNILFIDDESFKIVNILKKSEGWINTESLKDIKSLNAPEIRRAHIVFVDINGVGSQLFNDQGLGVARGIKEKYPEKKVIIYSAETKHNVFTDTWDKVDGRLGKNADPIQFITKVEQLARQIHEEKNHSQ